jgi:CheY-like chemotaxis protein
MQILFVEDNDQDAFLVRQAIQPLTDMVSLEIVPDGHAAFDYLRRKPPFESAPAPDLVLLDINLPGHSGLEILKQIKSDAVFQHLAVLMFSTSDLEEDIRSSYARGASSYLVKPGSFKELQRLVFELVRYWTGVSRRALGTS